MKTIFTALAALLFASMAHAADSEWIEIGKSANGVRLIAPTRIIATGNGRPTAWLKQIATKQADEVSYAIMLVRFDCARQKNTFLAETDYRADGSVVASFAEAPPEYIIPGSLGDTTSQIVCQIDKSEAAKSVKAL